MNKIGLSKSRGSPGGSFFDREKRSSRSRNLYEKLSNSFFVRKTGLSFKRTKASILTIDKKKIKRPAAKQLGQVSVSVESLPLYLLDQKETSLQLFSSAGLERGEQYGLESCGILQ